MSAMPDGDSVVPPALYELEAEIMAAVWATGQTTVRDVLEALNASGGKQRAYTTVMTTMMRMDAKKLLRRQRRGRTDIYEAALSEKEYCEARARAEVGALVEQYGEVALMNFIRQTDELDPERRRQLRRLSRRA